MSNAWERIGAISPGGTVFHMAADAEQELWLVTGAGIFHAAGNTWRPLRAGRPLVQINALAWAGKVLLVGGGSQIVYSPDRGDTWYQAQTGPVSQPITWLAASPVFYRDGLALAGTDGAGILRSTDRGKSWRPANAGLADLSVIALATAPEEAWERQAVVFAATGRGLYRSINGGLSWSRPEAGLDDLAVQAVAISPNFARDGLALAATETDGLFRSKDRGKSWHRWGEGLETPAGLPSLNCLWLHPDFAGRPICLAGTGEGQIYRSADGGATWSPVVAAGPPVFYLANAGPRLFAGLHGQGLLVSDDEGQTWRPDTTLTARAVTRLVAGYDNHLFSLGTLEGVWHSPDAGQNWTQVLEAVEQAVLSAAASARAERPCLLVGTATGLLRSEDEGRSWQPVLAAGEVTTITFSPHFHLNGQVWAGTAGGELFTSADGGLTWLPQRPPRPEQPLIVLAASPVPARLQARPGQPVNPAEPPLLGALAAATYSPAQRQVTLWRSNAGDKKWKQWMQVAAEWPSAQISLAGQALNEALACIGPRCWQARASGWQRCLEADQPISRLERLPGPAGLLALTAGQVLHSLDGSSWTPLEEGLAGEALLDLALLPQPETGALACVLSAGGVLWRREI